MAESSPSCVRWTGGGAPPSVSVPSIVGCFCDLCMGRFCRGFGLLCFLLMGGERSVNFTGFIYGRVGGWAYVKRFPTRVFEGLIEVRTWGNCKTLKMSTE